VGADSEQTTNQRALGVAGIVPAKDDAKRGFGDSGVHGSDSVECQDRRLKESGEDAEEQEQQLGGQRDFSGLHGGFSVECLG
jgi:hypothetical protein